MVDRQETYTWYDWIYANRLEAKAKHPNYLPCIEHQWYSNKPGTVSTSKSLGVLIDANLIWGSHIERLAKKVASGIMQLSNESKQKFGFIKRVSKGWIATVKGFSKPLMVAIQPLSTYLIKPNVCFHFPTDAARTKVSLETRNLYQMSQTICST